MPRPAHRHGLLVVWPRRRLGARGVTARTLSACSSTAPATWAACRACSALVRRSCHHLAMPGTAHNSQSLIRRFRSSVGACPSLPCFALQHSGCSTQGRYCDGQCYTWMPSSGDVAVVCGARRRRAGGRRKSKKFAATEQELLMFMDTYCQASAAMHPGL